MPKAIRFHALGGPEVLKFEDVPLRELAPDEVLLDVAAVGLNRSDSMFFHGHYPEQPHLPSGLGAEVVGTVSAVGPGGDTAIIGKRFGVIPTNSMNRHPVLAEQAIVPAASLAAFPDFLSDSEGAAVWMQYAAAYGALMHYGKVSAGDFVLITAASSSVGLAAIQIVKAQGGISIATTRMSNKRDELLRLGADHVIVTNDEDLPARVQEITQGKQARLVLDSVGGEYMNTLGRATASGGTIILYGLLSGRPPAFPMSIFGRDIAMYGYSLSAFENAERLESLKSYVYNHLADRTFKPEIAKTFPFHQAVAAYEYLESNEQIGKIVITF